MYNRRKIKYSIQNVKNETMSELLFLLSTFAFSGNEFSNRKKKKKKTILSAMWCAVIEKFLDVLQAERESLASPGRRREKLCREVTSKSRIEGEIEVVVDLCVLWGITLPGSLFERKIFIVCALLSL